ncbi:UNVERIFIED_ORG: leader peptidase (prepilin peptidase)/N-methyltransferase [Arthrobacter sp. UYEF1]
MTIWNNAGTTGPLFVDLVGVLGLILSPLAELLIARFFPRVGPLPTLRSRIKTAVVTAALCGGFAYRFGTEPVLAAFVLLAVLGVQLARIDVSLHLLPNPLVLSLLLGALVCFTALTLSGQPWSHLIRAVAGAALLFVIYLTLASISPAGIGMGDVKLAAPVGLYLGYLGWSQVLYGGLLGFILNGIITVLAVAQKPKERVTEVAHGPSMLGAAAGVALFLS